ncbi:hypothetical protein BDA96_03G023900 [Sorghum bicolor]|uniref:Uncharacterized protein n=1 Tax=Sorghum bicolor TaxID=4558 RepID=A0A921RBH3_SORBI|nr:hypothetical protein BDA96_03G023900 [Sorghum bicolor]
MHAGASTPGLGRERRRDTRAHRPGQRAVTLVCLPSSAILSKWPPCAPLHLPLSSPSHSEGKAGWATRRRDPSRAVDRSIKTTSLSTTTSPPRSTTWPASAPAPLLGSCGGGGGRVPRGARVGEGRGPERDGLDGGEEQQVLRPHEPVRRGRGGGARAQRRRLPRRRHDPADAGGAAAHNRYISYAALRADQVPCNKRGRSYYSNCASQQAANPYRRGCSAITRCARNMN